MHIIPRKLDSVNSWKCLLDGLSFLSILSVCSKAWGCLPSGGMQPLRWACPTPRSNWNSTRMVRRSDPVQRYGLNKDFSLVVSVGFFMLVHFSNNLGKMYCIRSFVPVFWIHHTSQKWQKQCFKCLYYASCANTFTWSFPPLHSLIRNSFCHPVICSTRVTRLDSNIQARSMHW